MTSKSQQLFERAQACLPGGVSRNTVLRDPHPIYVDRGEGCNVWDVEGNHYLDFANNVASLVHGHAYPPVVEALTAQLKKGTAFTLATEIEIEYAELLCARAASFDKVRFMNSGTEAVMAALKAARAFTGKPKMAKVEGAYHGAYDYAEVSQGSGPATWGDRARPTSVPLAAGTPSAIPGDVVVLPFNDPDAAVAVLDQNADQIACVLIDPMPHRVGLIPASADYVRAIYDWTRRNDALFIFDEVITFRTEFGGMQARFDIKPDLTTMGKMLGGGFPVGVLGGRDDVMAVFVKHEEKGLRLPHAGTFSANPMTMTAGYIAMRDFDEAAVARLNKLGDAARAGLEEAISVSGVDASVVGTGSMFRIHLKAEAPIDYRTSFPTPEESKRLSEFIVHMYDGGIIMVHTAMGILSTAMGQAEIDRLCEVALEGLRKL